MQLFWRHNPEHREALPGVYIKGSNRANLKATLCHRENIQLVQGTHHDIRCVFACDKTPMVAAYKRVLCSTLIYKCTESFCRVSFDLDYCGACVFVYDEAKEKIVRFIAHFQVQIVQESV